MGKGQKRKNPGVGVDFRKVKHKVGKKLPKAQNETRTDFQARSINLPNQSITQDKTGAAVSERNLTLKELVSQLSHHNISTRRDALTGLQQLISAHPAEARRHTALLLEALTPRLSDGEPSVRSALLTTLRGAVLPALGPSALNPFMPLLMAHISAALTNLSADVRFDALAVLGAVTETAPELMATQQQLGAALAHYTGLLSRANRGKSVKSQALLGLLKIVASLDKFLQAALGAAGGSSGSNAASLAAAAAAGAEDAAGRFSSSCDDSPVLLMSHCAAVAPTAACQVPSAARLLQLYCPGLAADSSKETKAKSSSSSSKQQQGGTAADAAACSADGSSSRPLQQQVLSLLDVLFDCWSEAAPGSLSTAPEAESAQVLVHILNSTQLIMSHFNPLTPSTDAAATANATSLGACLGTSNSGCPEFDTHRDQMQWLQQAAAIVLPKLLKAFPVAPPTTRSLSGPLWDLLQRFNLLAMQLLSGFMAAGVIWPALQQQQQQQQQQQGVPGALQQQEWQQRLLEFMAGVLATGSCLPALEQAAAAAGGSSTHSSNKGQQAAAAAAGSVAPASSSLSSSTVLVTVLQSLQQLLPQLTGPTQQHILAAVGQLAAAAAPQASTAAGGGGGGLRPLSAAAAGAAGSNAVRSACLRLQLQLMLQQLWQGVPASPEEADVAAWLAAAPKLLYELGSSKPKISQLLLQLLFEAARLSVPGSAIEQQLQALQPQLAALLVTALPPAVTKQPKQKTGAADPGTAAAAAAAGQAVRLLVGPLADLPSSCQHTALDLLAHLPQLTPPLLKAAALFCRITSYSDAAVQRLLDALLSSAASSMPPDVFVSFAATLLSVGPLGGYVDRASKRQVQAGFVRHQLVVDSVCRWLHAYGPLTELLPLLAGPLLQQWQQQQQQQGAQAAAGTVQQRQQQVCCLSYSLAAVAAVGAGCWVPSSSSSSGVRPPAEAQSVPVPVDLLAVLPAALAAQCLSRSSSSSSSSTDGFAAEAGLERCMQQMVLPLAYTLPSGALLMPFLQQLVIQGLSDTQQQQHGGLRVVCVVLKGLLGQQGLRVVLLQQQVELQGLLGQLEAAAREVQEQQGDAGAVNEVQQLQTALAVLCKH